MNRISEAFIKMLQVRFTDESIFGVMMAGISLFPVFLLSHLSLAVSIVMSDSSPHLLKFIPAYHDSKRS